MFRKLVRVALWVVAVQAAAFIVGQILSRKLTKGDEQSDEFQVAAIFGGKKFESHASGLKSGAVITSMGGVDIDLREATLDAGGAALDLRTTMGGIQVVVPADWAVEVEADSKAGGFDARVTPADELPVDAPKLQIHAVTRMGGVLVTTTKA
ncbi:MAG: cell wall-active antibiotics response protein [Acidimicrobiia bacterium]|nr:cell wall-active antibiotics response protein [Acidimicrobiia bacterium]